MAQFTLFTTFFFLFSFFLLLFFIIISFSLFVFFVCVFCFKHIKYPVYIKMFCYKTKVCSIKGWEMKEELRETFLECQMCERNVCQFRRCSDLLASSIFCKNTSARFQGKTTSTLMSNYLTSDVILASRSTTKKSGIYILL